MAAAASSTTSSPTAGAGSRTWSCGTLPFPRRPSRHARAAPSTAVSCGPSTPSATSATAPARNSARTRPPSRTPWSPRCSPPSNGTASTSARTSSSAGGAWTPSRRAASCPPPATPTTRCASSLYTGSAVEPEWLRTPPTRPRVCLTYGASVRGYAPRFATVPLPVLMEAFAGMDIEVVATLNDEEIAEAGTIPDNVRTVDYLPFTQLLPTCSAIVYQGGDGTFGCAAPQSLPQLINLSPKWGELAVAQYVESRGAGLVVEREGATAESVRGQLHRILTEPAFRKGAEELCREITAMPTPHAIVPLLEELAKKPADATA
ncbi:DUF1205 domain-containing protein (plasmid) [Streptomyces albidoflavus]|nr:DUF1205 domain-containing protein [Streptomyces albidoflavus]